MTAVLFLAAFSPEDCFGKGAKDFYREGERLIRSQDPYGAYKAFAEAVKLDARNKKYQRALTEAANSASDACVAEATGKFSADPKVALQRLKSALDYNPENWRASETLTALQGQIGDAKQRVDAERRSLDPDRIDAAGQVVRDSVKYKDLIPEFALLDADLSAARRLLKAQTALKSGDLLAATTVLAGEQITGGASDNLKSVERKLRSAALTEAGNRFNVSKPETFGRARAAALLQTVSDRLGETNSSVEGARRELLSYLSNLPNRSIGQADQGGAFRDHPAVLLEALEVLTRDTIVSAQAQSVIATLKRVPLRSVRLRFRGPKQPSCTILSSDTIRDFSKTVSPVVLTDGEDYDVAISIAEVSCQETDNPRASVGMVNSTYVVGQSQVVNPEYIQIKARLDAAQIELARIEATSNNSFMIGLYRGTVMGLQRRLSQTPPFSYQDLKQAYQLQEFVSKRQVYIKASGTYLIHVRDVHGGKEFAVEADRSTEDSGLAGALPQDSIYSNREAQLKPFEDLRRGAVDDFERAFRRQTKQAICDLLALAASDETANELARMDAMLQLAQSAGETTYADQRAGLVGMVEARLLSDGGNEARSQLSLPRGFQKPDLLPQSAANQTPEASSEGVAGMIDRILDGVVAIETDAGS